MSGSTGESIYYNENPTVGEISSKKVKIVKTKKGRFVEIDPLYQELTHGENIIFLTRVTNVDKLKMLFLPDLTELYLLISSFLILLLFARLGDFSIVNAEGLIFFGILALFSYTYRWAYAGTGHFIARQKRIKQELNEGKHLVVDFKLFGIVLSLLLIVFGIKFSEVI